MRGSCHSSTPISHPLLHSSSKTVRATKEKVELPRCKGGSDVKHPTALPREKPSTPPLHNHNHRASHSLRTIFHSRCARRYSPESHAYSTCTILNDTQAWLGFADKILKRSRAGSINLHLSKDSTTRITPFRRAPALLHLLRTSWSYQALALASRWLSL